MHARLVQVRDLQARNLQTNRLQANVYARSRILAEPGRLDEDCGCDAGRAERILQGNSRSDGGCLFSWLPGPVSAGPKRLSR